MKREVDFSLFFSLQFFFLFLNNKNLITPKSIIASMRQRLEPVSDNCLNPEARSFFFYQLLLLKLFLYKQIISSATVELPSRDAGLLFGFTHKNTLELYSTNNCTGPVNICRNIDRVYRYLLVQ